MGTITSAVEEFRTSFPASQLFTDLCNINYESGTTNDGFGGTIPAFTDVALNVPCSIKAMRSPMQVQIGGGGITTLTHEVRMGANAITTAIKPHYRIVILAHHNEPEKIALNPVTLDGSMDVFMIVAVAIQES